MMKKVFSALLILLVFALSSLAQETRNISYSIESVSKESVFMFGTPQITAHEYQVFKLNIDALKAGLDGVTFREGAINGFVGQIDLPHTDGSTRNYTVKRNQTLHPDLNAKFPEIMTLDAYSNDGSGARGKWDITPHGLHAMIFIPGESTMFIDPMFKGNTEYYIVYRKKDFYTDKVFECTMESALESDPSPLEFFTPYGTCELRTYRLALAATAEYSIFHGGTVPLALAAQSTSMNRVNGVYEKDIAVTMTIIPNNDLLIYTSNPDPYTNGNASTMLNQNQTNVTSVIGSANYDIGHVFGTNSGGVAGLGVVCNNNSKARGVTGSGAPINDPFDIDYVAHEMGHQFGANHTQNNPCNSVSAARREPGSASTIMGYAGICAPNVQNNSDDYFHNYSLQEISNLITGTAGACPVYTTLNNTGPIVVSTNGNVTIPISTPFALTAIATDPDGDVLTYLWEQMNNQQTTQPPLATATGGPNFRSWVPDTLNTRYFPKLSAIANNGPFTWERLPSVARTMNFRVGVFDNHSVGSCSDYVDVTVTTTASAGPFVVTYPSASGIVWSAGNNYSVTWNVANTNLAPVNCDSVKILLSIDGGLSYPFVLETLEENDGTHSVMAPNVTTTTARVMVISKNGTFFDISDNNFTIISCSAASIPVLSESQTICSGESVTLSILSGSLNDSQDWQWYAGACSGTPIGIGSSIQVSPIVTTTYFAVGGGGCPGMGCASVTIDVTPPINTFVFQQGATLTALMANANYQWLDCNNNYAEIPGALSHVFTPSNLVGSYAAYIYIGNCADTSACFLVDQSSVLELNTGGISVFPNPFRNEMTVQWETLDVVQIEILDVAGRVLQETEESQSGQAKFFTEKLSSGVYFIRLIHKEGILVERVVKQ
jgi:hypothetical protein